MPHRLNLKHLYYFWQIARTGSLTEAGEQLGLTPQTLSSQLAALEDSTGSLFVRQHRRLQLTPLGEEIKASADDIFALVEQLDQRLQTKQAAPLTLCAGISASIHKLTAYQLLEPAITLDQPLRLKCLTGHLPDLLKSLSSQKIDILLSDQLPPSQYNQLYCQHLFSSSLSLFAAETLIPSGSDQRFPELLHGLPILVNDLDAPYYAELNTWLKRQGIRMRTQLEVNDSALIKVFGRQGYGVFAAPSHIADEVCRQYGVQELGQIDSIQLPHYLISRTPLAMHIAVKAICTHFASKNTEERKEKI